MDNQKESRMIVIFNMLMAFYPWISTYSVPGIPFLGLNELLGIIMILFYFIYYKGKLVVSNLHAIYFILIVYSTIVSLGIFLTLPDFGDMRPINRPLRNIVQFILIAILGLKLFNPKYFVKYYTIGATITSLFLIVQNIIWFSLHKAIPWLIPGLPLNYTITDQMTYYAHFINKYYHYDGIRATGGFTEPTSFASYVLPLIALLIALLISNKEKLIPIKNIRKVYWSLVVMITAIILSTSATGLVCLCIIFGVAALKYLSRTNIVYAVILGIIITIFIVGEIYYIQTSEWGQEILLRLSEVDVSNGSTSGNQRIIRGFAVWNELPIFMQFIGTGFGNISSILISYDITTPYDPSFGSAYMSGLSELLVSTGVIGFIMALIYILIFVYGNIYNLLEVLTVFFILMLSLNMLASGGFVTIMVMITGLVLWRKKYNDIS